METKIEGRGCDGVEGSSGNAGGEPQVMRMKVGVMGMKLGGTGVMGMKAGLMGMKAGLMRMKLGRKQGLW